MRRRTIVERLRYDLRWAARSCTKTPGLTLTIVVTVALGVGASLASFSLVNTLLLRPIGGVVRPGELVRIAAADAEDYLLPVTSVMRESLGQLPAFTGVCGVNTPGGAVTLGDRVASVGLLHFSGGCFDVLGVKPRLGRLLTAEDDRGRTPVAVATDDFWRRDLGGTPDVLGRTIDIGGHSFTIVGVAEPAFRGLSTAFPSSLVVPISAARRTSPDVYWSEVVARRAPHASCQATEEDDKKYLRSFRLQAEAEPCQNRRRLGVTYLR
jgi:hypothetical protein